jgi:hypothetical protein
MMTEGFNLKGTLNAPVKHHNIPTPAKWLSGEGAGSWFYLEKNEDNYSITRFSPSGVTECKGIFNTENLFDIDTEYKITFLSHCAEVKVIQNNLKIKFTIARKLE